MSTLTRASHEWATRPHDQRYTSVAALHEAALDQQAHAAEAKVTAGQLHVSPDGEEVVLGGEGGNKANLTNWSFGQLCRIGEAPAGYLSSLKPETAAAALNESLRKAENSDHLILFDRREVSDGEATLTARAITSRKYTRVWNADLTSRLLRLSEQGWNPAPAAYDGSRGLYLSDRDMFAFMVDNDRRIFETDPNGGFSRGFFAWNSEVGSRKWGLMTFLYQYICGNHLVWEAKDVSEIEFRHIGKVNEKIEDAMEQFSVQVRKYADSAGSDDEAKIIQAKNYELAGTKDEVLDRLFGLNIPDLSMKALTAAYDRAEQHEDWYGNPRSVFGMVSGLTEIARELPNADKRHDLEKAAGKVMQISF